MSDCMTFPDTVEEFMEQYKVTDTYQVYSNGTEFVPIFRMKQWFEHRADRMKLVQQAVNTIMSTSRSYSIRDRAFRNAARLVQNAIDGKAPDFEQIPEGDEMPPEPKWIPCSERLPENGRQVLVYARSVHYALAKYDEMREADGTYKKQWVTFDAWKPFYTIKEVIAWMPLPEPYREEGD